MIAGLLVLSALAAANLDEPKQFLVVNSATSQTVVDSAAWCPDRNDHVRTIDSIAEPGISNWSGTRLAFLRDAQDGKGRAVFVQDLAKNAETDAKQCSKALRSLEIIGWLESRSRVVIREREAPEGQMLRIIGAHLSKDSNLEFGTDVTEKPGVYKCVTVNRQNSIAYFSVKGNDRGSVVVWKHRATRVMADDVAATAICWSPDGARLAIAELGKVTILDAATATKLCTHTLPHGCKGAEARIGAMAWHPYGSSIALLPDWPEPDHMPNNPRVWSLDPVEGDCTVLVQLVSPALGLRWLDGGACDTTLTDACELAKRPVRGHRP